MRNLTQEDCEILATHFLRAMDLPAAAHRELRSGFEQVCENHLNRTLETVRKRIRTQRQPAADYQI